MTSSANLNELGNIIIEKNQLKTSNETSNNISLTDIMVKNDAFMFKTANMFLTLLLLSSLFDVLCNYTKTGIVVFIINLCLFHFYNMNSNMFDNFDTSSIIETLRHSFSELTSFILFKTKSVGVWLFDKLFSKNTQFVLKIIFKIAKSNIISKYEYYRNTMFNPKLLNETNNECVYCVPLYLNGVNYKIPVVVEKHNTKNQPLMILNKDEEDITSRISEFLGPNNDFFGMILKPRHFGEKSLSFMLDDGSETTMEEYDLIVL